MEGAHGSGRGLREFEFVVREGEEGAELGEAHAAVAVGIHGGEEGVETGALVAPEGVAQGGVRVQSLHAGADDVRGGDGRDERRDERDERGPHGATPATSTRRAARSALSEAGRVLTHSRRRGFREFSEK